MAWECEVEEMEKKNREKRETLEDVWLKNSPVHVRWGLEECERGKVLEREALKMG